MRLKVICKFKHYVWGLTSRKTAIVPLYVYVRIPVF